MITQQVPVTQAKSARWSHWQTKAAAGTVILLGARVAARRLGYGVGTLPGDQHIDALLTLGAAKFAPYAQQLANKAESIWTPMSQKIQQSTFQPARAAWQAYWKKPGIPEAPFETLNCDGLFGTIVPKILETPEILTKESLRAALLAAKLSFEPTFCEDLQHLLKDANITASAENRLKLLDGTLLKPLKATLVQSPLDKGSELLDFRRRWPTFQQLNNMIRKPDLGNVQARSLFADDARNQAFEETFRLYDLPPQVRRKLPAGLWEAALNKADGIKVNATKLYESLDKQHSTLNKQYWPLMDAIFAESRAARTAARNAPAKKGWNWFFLRNG